MRILLSSNDSLTAAMSGAAATTNPTYHVLSGGTAGGLLNLVSGSLNGSTAVTLAAAPSDGPQKIVPEVEICNVDTAAVTITLTRIQNGTSYTLAIVTLQASDHMFLDASGIRVTDTSGQLKQTATSTTVAPFALEANNWYKTDGVTVTPVTAATTNFGLVLGTDGTDFPHLETIDGKAATTIVVARRLWKLPPNYVAGSDIILRARAGMKTTIADNSAATTLGFLVYSNSGVANLGSANINGTAAQSINSLTAANFNNTISGTGLVAGQDLHIKMSLTVTDAATVTAVIGTVNHVELRCSVSQ